MWKTEHLWPSEADWDTAHSEHQAPRRSIDVTRNAVPATVTTIIGQRSSSPQESYLSPFLRFFDNIIVFSWPAFAIQSDIPFVTAHFHFVMPYILIF